MKSPTCRFDNETDAKFCNKCGGKLEIACPECGHNSTVPSEPASEELSFDEKIAKIQRYSPAVVPREFCPKQIKSKVNANNLL